MKLTSKKTTDLCNEFMAPEYWTNHKCSYETDTFWPYFTLFYLILGKKPEQNDSNEVVLNHELSSNLPKILHKIDLKKKKKNRMHLLFK